MLSPVTVFRRAAGLGLLVDRGRDCRRVRRRVEAGADRAGGGAPPGVAPARQFSHAADASNRAVMADTDEASRDAAHEAEQATQADRQRYRGAAADPRRPGRSRRNRPARPVQGALRPIPARSTPTSSRWRSRTPTSRRSGWPSGRRRTPSTHSGNWSRPPRGWRRRRAPPRPMAPRARGVVAVLEIQVIEARHIAESDETAMTGMEGAMQGVSSAARNGARFV